MRENFNEFLKDKIVRISIALSFFVLLVQLIFLFVTYKSFPPYVPLFNSMPWGEDRLYTSAALFFFPLILFLVFTVNNFFGAYFYKKYALISRMLSFNAFLFIVLAIIGYTQILLLIY